jgi:hypothetical protein
MELIVLWEFSSALTPTAKGGPLVMLFVLTKEKLSAGRTAAAVFYTMICDTGFFVFLLPVMLLIYGPSMLFPGMKSFDDVGLASGAFFFTYTMMAALVRTAASFEKTVGKTGTPGRRVYSRCQ